jgi:hypothetical protein
MLRVMLVLGVLVLIPAVIIFWRTKERSVVDSPADGGAKPVSSRPVGRSILSHGGPSPADRPKAQNREMNVPERNLDPNR